MWCKKAQRAGTSHPEITFGAPLSILLIFILFNAFFLLILLLAIVCLNCFVHLVNLHINYFHCFVLLVVRFSVNENHFCITGTCLFEM